MKRTLLTILFPLITITTWAQSVKTKARAIMKELNLPANIIIADLPDNEKGLIIAMKAIDTTADLTEYYRDMTEPIAIRLRYNAIGDSSCYFSFLSICYNSTTKNSIIFNFKMNDKIFKRSKQKS